jgi:hypothetical protein
MIASAAVAVATGAAIAAGSLAVGGSKHSTPSRSPGSVAASRCRLSELRIHRIGSYAGLGESGGYYGLTNTSPQRCSLKGWPYVVAIKADGTTATGKQVKETFYGPFKAPPHPPEVDLKPGATAAFALTTSDSTLSGKGACPAPYRRLRIGLAHGSPATTISGWIPYSGQYFQACTRFLVSELMPRSDLRG